MEDLSENRLLITNIQRFSLHDGPGIRTTVFLKGCSLHCPWCANPENISGDIEPYFKDGKSGVYGRWYNANELYAELIKDVGFFRESCLNKKDLSSSYRITSAEQLEDLPGSVTFSGGEPLIQAKNLQPLMRKLNEDRIHLCVETCLFVPHENLQMAVECVDLFYVDLKILEAERCRKILSGSLGIFESNLYTLMQRKCPVVFRVPVIAEDELDENGTLDSINQLLITQKISDCIKVGNIIKVELIKEHNLGLSKYRALKDGGADVNIPKYLGVSDRQMEDYKQVLLDRMIADQVPKDRQVPVEICKI